MGTAGTAERIQLVDEDDRRRLLSRLFKQVAYPRGADTHKHLNELRAGNRKELDARLARDRPRQQRLDGARWADQQDPLGHPGAEPPVYLRIAQKIDDFL